MKAGAFTHLLVLEGLKKGLQLNKGWFTIHKRIITTYKQARKEIFEGIKIEDRMLLKKEREKVRKI